MENFRPNDHMRKVNDELMPPYVEKETLLAYTKVLIYTVFCYQLYWPNLQRYNTTAKAADKIRIKKFSIGIKMSKDQYD